ncbi:MAG: GerMN domain-containing protein [Bacilli bacterium]|nr:GerMN domain-containing protein [Bacilli bacterium]
MLKRRIIKRILISTGALFALLLIYLVPVSTEDVNISSIEETSITIKKSNIYLLTDNNMLGMTSVIVDTENTIDRAKELLEILIHDGKGESNIPNGFRSFIPSETVINGITYEDKILTVDFNNALLNVSKDYEMAMIESIIYTLTEIDDVSYVVITVDGVGLDRLPNSNLKLPLILSRKFGINKEYDITSLSGINSITEYYVSKYNDNYYYVPVTKFVNDDRDKIKIIIEDLTSSNIYMTNLMSFINSNTKLLEANVEENKMELTFNSYILNDFDKKDILEEVIEPISLSIKDNYDVDEVIFYVNDMEICKSVLKTIE